MGSSDWGRIQREGWNSVARMGSSGCGWIQWLGWDQGFYIATKFPNDADLALEKDTL